MHTKDFAERLLAWHAQHGRHDLPWQQNPTPYRVWVSEIMLQQTRVITVLPYFGRFITRFPEVQNLAEASIDEVLAHWSGLGYYARARNLHRAAQKIVAHHDGIFPKTLEVLRTLPGIGRSTAGAILTLAYGIRQPILDGNVKRVLTRYHAAAGWPGEPKVEQYLWDLAESHTPEEQTAAYTQAIMDLGATLCTRSKPECVRCPFLESCRACALGKVLDFPESRPQRTLPVKKVIFILLLNQKNEVLLERRPTKGIWGGLWIFPSCPPEEDPVSWLLKTYGWTVRPIEVWAQMRHTLTHLHIDITPWVGRLKETAHVNAEHIWHNTNTLDVSVGIAAPVMRLLGGLKRSFRESLF
ncbi:Adenine DNA glycosylase [Gammaproteobacteria bacterium]